MQIAPELAYDHQLAERVIAYLQTRDSRLFPFTARFDAEQRRAFMRDLREGLAEITDSGSARKTSATGFIMSDSRLREIVQEWYEADGDWPRGTLPQNPVTMLGAVPDESEEEASPDRVAEPA